MRVEIARLHRELGNTMIYVTHDQVEAMTLADKIVVLRGGVIEQVGPPARLYDDPDNLFVAGFIGSPRMNTLNGRWHAGGIVEIDGVRLPGPALTAPPRDGADVVVGIRPEHLARVDADGPALRIRLDVAEFLGGTTWLYCTTTSGQRIVMEAPRSAVPNTGELFCAAADPDGIRLFDPSGPRLR